MEQLKPNKKIDDLLETVLGLKNIIEARAFFRDLCTMKEIGEMADRWEMAKMIDQGVPYREIAKKLKVSTTTVSRVAYWLSSGMDGYRLALEQRLKNTNHHRDSSSSEKGLRFHNIAG